MAGRSRQSKRVDGGKRSEQLPGEQQHAPRSSRYSYMHGVCLGEHEDDKRNMAIRKEKGVRRVSIKHASPQIPERW